jgi:hypothetical protein
MGCRLGERYISVPVGLAPIFLCGVHDGKREFGGENSEIYLPGQFLGRIVLSSLGIFPLNFDFAS